MQFASAGRGVNGFTNSFCDSELAEAFRDRWILPRRALAKETIERAMEQG